MSHLSLFYLWQERSVAVIPFPDKLSPALEYHLSAVRFCPRLSQRCCLAQVSLPDGAEKDAARVPPRSSPLGRFCCFVSARLPLWGSSPGCYGVSHGQIVCSSAPAVCNLLPVAEAAAAGLPCLVALAAEAELSIPPGTGLGVMLVAGDLPCLAFYRDTGLLATSLPGSGMCIMGFSLQIW